MDKVHCERHYFNKKEIRKVVSFKSFNKGLQKFTEFNSIDYILYGTDYIIRNRFLCVEACRNHVEYFDRDGKITVTDL
jgi:hypothetical protein